MFFMTFISWRRQLVLSTLEECISSSTGSEDPKSGEQPCQAFENLHHRLTASLPVKEIVATVEDLLTAHRNHCSPRQRELLQAYLDQLLVPAR